MARVNRKELHVNKKSRNGSSGSSITLSSCTTPGTSSSRPSCPSQKEPDPVTRLVNELISDLSPTNGGTSSRPSSSVQHALDPMARLVSDLVRNLSEEYDDPSSRGANEEDVDLEGYWDIGDPDVSCNKCGAMMCPNNPERFNDDLICLLQRMIDEENILAMRFRMARDRLSDDIEIDVSIRLISRRETDGRTYNRPTASEVAVLIEGDIGNAVEKRDIIIEKESGELQRISELHPLYLALQYPLLFPHGEDGLRPGILHSEASLNKTAKLLQQFIVDGYMMVESQRLSFLRHNQGLLRVETYKNLANAVNRGETEPSSAGSRIFMSSSVLQSDGYTIGNFQDTMTICKWYGYPDLFITFTCNPKWPEIMRFVSKRGLRPEDRPDILSRVFKMKLAELMKDLKDRHIFGRVIGGTYTIEFQKRGLPHAHILIFLHRDDKFPEAANVDKIISAEIPDLDENPLLYALVKENMIHCPCGKDFPTCPCMVASKCSRNFPKRCIESTTVDDDGYPVYKKREKGFTVVKSGRKLGNEWVVPYNAQLLLKYRAHINVECCNQARSIKYLFKYINKGPDRATMQSSYRRRNEENPDQIDEIQRLRFHLPDEQSVVFNDEDPIDDSKFLAWMDCNKSSEEAQQLLYSQFPTKFVWKQEERAWHPRKSGFALGRMHNVSPNCGELYYMRTLLNFIKGPKSYEDLRWFDDVLHPTFRGACYARGLLGDDKEYIDAIEEASRWGSGSYLRNLFVTLLLSAAIAMPSKVWEKTWKHLSDDILYQQRNALQNQALRLTEDELKNYALLDIKACLQRNGSSLRRFEDMPFPESSTPHPVNTLVSDELSYDRVSLGEEHVHLLSSMTNEQMAVYNEIMDAVPSSGIAATLLPGGITAHSRLSIPLNVVENSTCSRIKPGSDLAELLIRTKLIIWDEAPMTHKYAFEVIVTEFKRCHAFFERRRYQSTIWW
ncbi:uncharacterized protein LOC141614650 [Silene latifolia]|uniref:uncharacterized protein LOC141614650 n=1 Tax=Silene latifolia TaxID=37657 RepID=UPI003D78808C